MSVSLTSTDKKDGNFVDVEFRPKPQETHGTEEPRPEGEKETTESLAHPGLKDEQEKPEQGKAAKTEETPAKSAEKAAKPKTGWSTVLLDVLLVLMLVALVGGGGYYLKQELDRYRVPSAMEIAMEENYQLSRKRESLQEAYYHADEQIHMRKNLASLNSQLDGVQNEIADLERSIADQRDNILALQHEIRQSDADARSVARSLLPGMPIGTASTTTGKSIRNAVIYRLVNNRQIDIRSNEGQVRVRIKDLVKDSLPPMARYAFKLDDLVDMSDFESEPGASNADPTKKPISKAAAPAKQPAQAARQETDYDPASGAPIVDTDANKTSTTGTVEDPAAPATSPDQDIWQAPAGDMPL